VPPSAEVGKEHTRCLEGYGAPSGTRLAIQGVQRSGASTLRPVMPMPQESWSDKDERQYEHVKKSEKDRGRSDSRAEEIAARTVNQQRREEGRTERKTTSGTGNPRSSLEDRSKDQLMNRAMELGIEGRSRMDKEDLIEAIRARQS